MNKIFFIKKQTLFFFRNILNQFINQLKKKREAIIIEIHLKIIAIFLYFLIQSRWKFLNAECCESFLF